MRYRGADDEQGNTERCGKQDPNLVVTPVTDRQRDDAEWNHDRKQLAVQVRGIDAREEGQAGYQQRKRKTMQQAQAGQPDGGTVEPR